MEYQRKPVVEFPGYEVDTDGNVYSYSKLKKGGKMNGRKDPRGYIRISLSKGGKVKIKGEHRIVLETFLGSCPEGMEACHNNGISTDNRLENLRWDTHKNNHADKKRHGTWQGGEKHGMVKLNEKQVRVIKHILTIPGRITHKQIGAIYNVNSSLIGAIATGRLWKHITIN